MEAKGKATVVLATERFGDLARQEAGRQGLPDARIATIEHPIGGVKRELLERRADAVVEEVMSRFLGH
jgi:hypothetical protein